MTYRTFLDFITTLSMMEDRCDEFNKKIEGALNLPFDKSDYPSDSTAMLTFPIEGVRALFINALINEFDESQEGAEWFVYEGINQILKDGTEIDNIKITTFKDYYDYLSTLKKDK